MTAHAFNPSTGTEVEAEGPLSLRPVLYTQKAPGQARLHKETLSQKNKRMTTKDTFTVFRKLKFTIAFPNLIQSIKL